MHMYGARKTCAKNRAITHVLKGEMRFATETSLEDAMVRYRADDCLSLSAMRHIP